MSKSCLVSSCDAEPDIGLEHCWRHRTHQIGPRPNVPAARPKESKPLIIHQAAPAGPAPKIHGIDPDKPLADKRKPCQAAACAKEFTAAGARKYCDEHRWVKGMDRAAGAPVPPKPPPTAAPRAVAPGAPTKLRADRGAFPVQALGEAMRGLGMSTCHIEARLDAAGVVRVERVELKP